MAQTEFPEPDLDGPRRSRLSWVWLMPLVAVVISVGVVWQTYRNQGPLIIVSFPIASGIEAGETPLRFRDVQVGLVEDVRFSPGFEAVEASIRIDRSLASFVDADAAFWVVEPQVSARGVTGLETVLSGVYIEALWDGEAGVPQSRFTALETSPLALPGEEGTRVVLRSREGGQLAAGAPVIFNGIEVGRLGTPTLSANGAVVSTEAFIEAPHDARLSTATRFWDISGISVNLDASGLSVDFESLASLVEGGVAFGSLVTGGEPVEDGHVFTVFGSREEARRNVFEDPVETALELAVLLAADDLRLALGATVRFGGLRVGEVTDIIGFTDPRAPEEGVQVLVTFSISPRRIGLSGAPTREELIAALATRVEAGLRVRVASEGLLGTSLILELTDDAEAAPAELATDLVDVPLVPSAPPNVTEASENLDAVIDRVAALPIEELMNAAIDALDGITALSTGEDLRALPANLNGLVSDARAVVAADEIRSTLADVSGAAEALEGLIARVSDSAGVSTTLTALEGSDEIIGNLRAFTGGLPGVLDEVNALLADLREAPVADVAGSADRVLRRIETILGAEGTEDLPASLNASLGELAAVLEELRAGGATANLVSTLGSADAAFSALEDAARQVPDIVTRLNGLVASLQTLSTGYDRDSAVYREVRAAIQDISQAADAFRSLSRSIERNPNSLITGR